MVVTPVTPVPLTCWPGWMRPKTDVAVSLMPLPVPVKLAQVNDVSAVALDTDPSGQNPSGVSRSPY